MAERDDGLSRRYRELPKEEPPAALDQAILASARRAVVPKPVAQRWAVPASLAAVLVLAVGLTVRMQQERPGIETAAPASEYAAPPPAPGEPATAAGPVAPATTEPVPPAKKSIPPALESTRAANESAPRANQTAPARPAPATPPAPQAIVPAQPQAKRDDSQSPAARRFEERLQQRTEPKAFADPLGAIAEPEAKAKLTAPVSTPPPPPAPAAAAPAAAAAAPPPPERYETRPAPAEGAALQRGKRQALGAKEELAKDAGADPRERELQRIAQLRRDGRHAEADAALEKFRKHHPGYKIPEALWEQVKPR